MVNVVVYFADSNISSDGTDIELNIFLKQKACWFKNMINAHDSSLLKQHRKMHFPVMCTIYI